MKVTNSYNATSPDEHIDAFTTNITEYAVQPLIDKYQCYCLEYFKYKKELMSIETISFVSLSPKLKKIKDYYGENIYDLMKKPMKLFPRQVARSNELREIFKYRNGKVSQQVMEKVDVEYMYKLFNIVHCHSNSYDIQDFSDGVLDGR